jgi:hypothetical protein
MLRRLVTLVVALAVAYAGWHLGKTWLHYQEFQDGVRDTALFGTGKSDDALRDRVMELAQRYAIPIDRDAIEIDRAGSVKISTSYVERVPIVPGYQRPIQFDVRTR